MLNSATQILEQYIDDVTFYVFHTIEMERSEHIEDRYYLCNIGNFWYIVYETDFVNSLPAAAKEAQEIFSESGFRPKHWLVKKLLRQSVGDSLPLDTTNEKALVTHLENSYLKIAVLEVEAPRTDTQHYNPTAYGAVSK